MAEQLTKLRPDRDLQCYFQRPTAAAALSQSSASGFTVSGSWRQQFDWAVVEWSRDNVFEHPALRTLPDGDLSGIQLSYVESRTNCIPMDSALYPTVEWPYLRIWVDNSGVDTLYDVPLKTYAMPADGGYTPATAQFTLQGLPTALDYIELAWLDQHFNYRLLGIDTLESAVNGLAGAINTFGDGRVTAAATGATIILTYAAASGENANRIGVYGTVHGTGTEVWSPACTTFSGGASPRQWRVNLNFSALTGYIDPDRTTLVPVPTTNVRKMRWTWAANLQDASFERSDFAVTITNWTVTGTNFLYRVAGTGSRRIEDDDASINYSAASQWSTGRGNFSGNSIHWTTTPGASLSCTYTAGADHTLYLGTRRATGGGKITVQVDGGAPQTILLNLPGEDMLVRVSLGQFARLSAHTVTIAHCGAAGSYFYFDFLELALPTTSLPSFTVSPTTTLATDWDTDHSIALAPERTAWMMNTLGFRGRANHYAGALWFYELCNASQQYAAGTITFSGTPDFGKTTTLNLGPTVISHMNLIGDTSESLAICFALLVNSGSTGVWASATGNTLTITSRTLGVAGDGMAISAVPVNSPTNLDPLTAVSSGVLAGGNDGKWLTDLTALPRINRAARDWSGAFFQALKGYGIDVAASFSMELQHGDDSVAAGIAQRYPNGNAAWLNTPALQTNFSPASTAFWQQVHADMADVMAAAGVVPYLQFGEVQWWYFPGQSGTVVSEPGMPFYDAYTTSAFQAAHGRPMATIVNQYAIPTALSQECAFLSGLIGTFTRTIRSFVRQSHANARFEVLYPPDVNNTALNQLVNFPAGDWTPANLDCLKTENFTFTGDRNLNECAQSIQVPAQYGFPASKSSHLVGIGDCTTPWQKEQRMALGARLESVVLFALDQFCLIGYSLPLEQSQRAARFMGR
jgi:hypothetical protein